MNKQDKDIQTVIDALKEAEMEALMNRKPKRPEEPLVDVKEWNRYFDEIIRKIKGDN